MNMTTKESQRMAAALQSAIEHAGGVSALVDEINRITTDPVSRTTVYYWAKTRVPAERAVEIERALSGAIQRADLRPDLFNCGFADV